MKGYFNVYEVSRLAQVDKSIVRHHVGNGIIPAKGVYPSYLFHPEDVRDYVYYTTGRLKRLIRKDLPNEENITNLASYTANNNSSSPKS